MRSTLRLLLCAALVGCAADSPEPPTDVFEEDTRLEILRPPVLRPDAMFPETSPGGLVDVEVLEDRLIFHFDATPPTIEPDTVVAGALGGGYLRRVTTVTELSGNRLELGTVGATLVELFDDVHFTYVFTPSVDRPGENIPYDSIESTVGASSSPLTINRTPVEVVPDSGVMCRTGGSATIDPFLTFEPRIEVEIDIRSRGWFRSPELRYARFAIGGALTLGADVTASTAPSITCTFSPDLDRFAARWTTRSPFPGVGVLVLKHKLGPSFEVTANWRGPEVTGTFTASATLNLRLGTEKPRGSDEWTNISGVGVNAEASIPEVTVNDNWAWSLGAEGGMKYELRAYDTIGPDFALTIPVTASGEGAGACYTEDLTIGANAHVGVEVKVPLLDYTIASSSWSWPIVPEASVDGWPREFGECDPCGDITECGACTQTDSCGWCDGRCVSTARADACSGSLLDNPSACEPCDATTCGECTVSGFCVWCPGAGCVNERSPEYAMMCDPATVQANPGDCGG